MLTRRKLTKILRDCINETFTDLNKLCSNNDIPQNYFIIRAMEKVQQALKFEYQDDKIEVIEGAVLMLAFAIYYADLQD